MPAPRKDHTPLEQDEFRGLYSRGASDTVPDSYFLDCLNIKFAESDVITRDGLKTAPSLTASNIVRFFKYQRIGETGRYIYLDTSGNLYDSLFPNNPIYSDASFLDFSLANFNNRAYITPHNRVKGIAGKYLLVYDGSGVARQAAGNRPIGFTLGAANSVTSGNVETGFHIFAVANITATGYVTTPGPATFTVLDCPGGFKVDISAIPVGGASIASIAILATKAIPTTGASAYDGNQLGYEYFFVPGAVVTNGTTILTISFFDSDLVDSADYLFDSLSNIPAGVGITAYGNRLAIWGEDANPHTIRLSKPDDPETIDSITGNITIAPDDNSSGIRNATVFRKSLLIFKNNRVKITGDNGDDPDTWGVDDVDSSVGTECFGIGMILETRGINNDRLMFASKSGLICYEGLVKRPELTYNIEDTWNRINKAKFNLIQVVDDPEHHRVVITVPLDAAVAISHVLYGDYSLAHTVYGTLDPKLIKWAIWTFPTAPVSMIGDRDDVSTNGILQFALAGGNIYKMTEESPERSDFGNAIDSWFKTSLKTAYSGWVNHFCALKLRMTGSGSLQIDLYGEDASNHQTAVPLTLATSPGYEPYRLINFQNEKLSVRFRVSLFGEYFTITKLIVYARELWIARPN